MERNFTLDQFTEALTKMIGTNDSSYNGRWGYDYAWNRSRDYTKEEIDRIINSGVISEKIELSRNYYYKDGFYRRIILHYATLLKYVGILIPNPSYGHKLSESSLQKRYRNALNFMESMHLSSVFEGWTKNALRDGAYYGIVCQLDKKHFTVLDLPVKFCRTRFKDIDGNDIVEFNVSYFDTLIDEEGKQAALSTYPQMVVDYYEKWKANKAKMTCWCMLPAGVGICFQLLNNGCPLFLNVIPATIEYDEAVETERERDAEEIRKIIVQQIPHLTDGGLLFEPQEAESMHRGAVGMMKGNKNVSVLTTYADVDSIVSKTSADAARNNLEKMVQNIYYESGASGQLFASNSNLSLATSLKNDLALVMILVKKYDILITSVINQIYGNGSLSFKYETLPVSWYNEDEYVKSALSLATSGYSFIIPSVAMGVSQRDLVNLKELENDVLDLRNILLPLQTSYTTSSDNDGAGAPTKDPQDKAEKTVANEESLDRGGSN